MEKKKPLSCQYKKNTNTILKAQLICLRCPFLLSVSSITQATQNSINIILSIEVTFQNIKGSYVYQSIY